MPPPSWKPCPHCNQQFSPASLDIHIKRCRDHKAVKQENEAFRERRYMQSYHWATPLPGWSACPNCGEKYSPIAMGPHVKRCRRLRPKGAAAAAARAPSAGGAFDGMWGVDNRPIPTALEKLGNSLKKMVSGDDEADAEDAVPPMDDETRQRLRTLFDKFDASGDGTLSQREHGMLLFNCFPDRVLDAKDLLAEFKTVDADG